MTLIATLTIAATATAATPNYADDQNYSDFVGRLHIDNVGIDVALYDSREQEVVDRDDSAAYFGWTNHKLIADHYTESFAPLGTVKVGESARIVREDGTVVYYECVDIFKGHNTGTGITDWNGKSVMNKADLLMYTCFDGWQNVWVMLWNKTLPPEDKGYHTYMQNVVNNTLHAIRLLTQNGNDE